MQRIALLFIALWWSSGALAAVGPAPMACHDCLEEPPPTPPAKKGLVEPIAWTNGHSDLVGWTCQQGRTESNDVHLYVGGPAGVGYFVVGTKANQYSEPAIAAQCGVTGSWYRYRIPLLENIRTQHPGKALYVYAVSSVGGAALLANSGQVTVPAIVNDAAFVAQTVPAAMLPGSTVTARVQMRNTGNTVWSHGTHYRLGAQNPIDNTTWGVARVNLPADVAPGQTATFDFAMKAPATTGARNFQWRIVRDGVAWFGASTPNVAVHVASGTLGATPDPCVIPWGASTCAATVQWTSSVANAEVWVTDPLGGNPTLFARAQNGAVLVDWLQAVSARFHLKAGGWSSLTLARRDVRGEPTVNQAPSVALTTVAGNVLVGQGVALGASAADVDDGIARVEFLVDGVEVGADVSAPYVFHWVPTQARVHAIRARAIDTRGQATLSGVVQLTATSKVGVTRRYTYNAQLELCRVDEPETGASFFGYDAAGNLAWSASGITGAAGEGCGVASNVAARRIDRTYDARGRLHTLRFPDGRGDLDHAYAPDGLLSAIVADNGNGDVVTTTYAYNARRLLTREVVAHGDVHWPIDHAYDANGHLAAQSWNGLTIDYAPNALGQATRAGTFATNVTYYPNGAIRQFTYGNGIVHTLAQNVRQLPETSTDAYGGVAYLSDAYDYDAVGNVAAITDGATGRNQRGNRTMVYDGLDRLVGATSPMFGSARYEYDALDNLTRVAIGGTAARDHWYCRDGSNRLTNVKTTGCAGGASVIGMGYDVQGNLANKNGVGFEFDYGNRLRSVATAAGPVTYAYDGHGRRVIDTTPAGVKFSQYTQDGRLVQALDERTKKRSQHVYLGGSLVAIREQDVAVGAFKTLYQHTDALGSPVVVTDAARNVVDRSEYEPYGKVLNRALNDSPGYTGHVEDKATGLAYAQQRYLDTDVPQFVSVDEVTPHEQPVTSFNRYRYGNNNPYKFVDPDGRFAWLAVPLLFGGSLFLTSEPANAPGPGQPTLPRMGPGESLASVVPPSRIAAPIKMAVDGTKTYQTYVKQPKDPATHSPYVGRTSGTGTPLENVSRRDRNHHANGTHAPATVDRSSANASAVRGREQQQIEANGGAQSSGGTSGNKINGISPANPKRDDYLRDATREFGG